MCLLGIRRNSLFQHLTCHPFQSKVHAGVTRIYGMSHSQGNYFLLLWLCKIGVLKRQRGEKFHKLSVEQCIFLSNLREYYNTIAVAKTGCNMK